MLAFHKLTIEAACQHLFFADRVTHSVTATGNSWRFSRISWTPRHLHGVLFGYPRPIQASDTSPASSRKPRKTSWPASQFEL